MPDIAGNSLATATTLNLTTGVQSFPDLVTSTTSDYYRFSLLTQSSLDLSLTNLDANADVALLDSNGNLLTINNVPQRSANSGNLAESINTILDPGTYFIRVSAAASVAIANYTLNVTRGTNTTSKDILWRDITADQTAVWQLNGSSVVSIPYFTSNPGVGWIADATGDFNKDGQSDVVWRNTSTGASQIWLMSGVDVAASAQLPLQVSPGWYVGGTGDFTGDGQIDLLWRNDAAGATSVWVMNGTQYVSAIALSDTLGASWRVGGVGDFNKDSKPDIVWQNSTDKAAGIWLMNGVSLISSANFPVGDVGPSWFIKGTGDYNSDGFTDILWRDYSVAGGNSVWLFNGVTYSTNIGLNPLSANWIPVGPYITLGAPIPIDIAGDTPTTAFDLGTNVAGIGSYRNSISSVSTDFYKFTLGSNSQVNLSLGNFTADLDLQLLDANGSIIQTVATPGLTPELLNRTLAVGTYYIQVLPNNIGDRTSYSLDVNINNLPVLTTNTPLPVNEQGTANLTSSQLRVTDDSPNTQLTYTLGSVPINGTLSVNGAVAQAGTTFTQADLDAGDRIRYVHNGSETTSDSFTFTVVDGGGGSISTTTFNIAVTPVNDPPVLTVPTSLSLDQDTNTLISGIQVADPDSGTGELTVTLAVQNGTLTLGRTNSITGLQGNGTSTVSFNGQLGVINFVLQSLVYRSRAGFEGTDVLQIGVNDNSNTGLGGPLSDSESTTLTITPVNDPPLITLPSSPSVNEDVKSAITGITIADPDAASGIVTASLNVANGVLSLSSTTGVTLNVGTGTNDKNLVFSGTLAAVNAALTGLSYQGDRDFVGSDSLRISISDNGNSGNGISLSDTKTLSITVTPVNDAPILTVPPAQTASENIDLRLAGISIQDVDAGTGSLNVSLSAANGRLSLGSTTGLTLITGTGNQDSSVVFSGSLAAINAALTTLTYRGNLNFRGADQIAVSVSDNGNTGAGIALGDSQTIAVNVLGINQPPVITLPTATPAVNSNTDLPITGISITDPDAASGNLSVTLLAANGLLTLNSTNGLTFTQGNGTQNTRITFSGPLFAINNALSTLTYRSYPGFTNAFDRITISTSDNGNSGIGLPLSDTETLFVNVGGAVNAAPVATNDTAGISQNNTLNGNSVLGNDTDPDFTLPLTAQLGAGPTRAATFTLNSNGTFTYVPTTNFNGTDSFTYTAQDALGAVSNTATVTITVTPVNQPPVATDNNYTTGSRGSLAIAAPGILADDTDIDSSNLSAVLVAPPANGTLGLNPNGSFTYVPRSGFTGIDSFTYRANDGSLNSLNTATVNITVTLTPNQLPIANGETFTTSANSTLTVGSVLTNDTDPDNNTPLTASLLVGPANAATFTLNSNGTFTYVPRPNFSGNDTFTYVAQDSLGGTSNPATATFSVTSVTPANRPPVANGESFSTTANTTVNVVGNVLTNDTDADNNVPLTASVVTRPANAATFTLNSDGSFTYLPNANFSGNDSFTYVAQDSLGATSGLATVTLSVTSVTPANRPPVANGESFTTTANTTVNVVGNVLSNDTDPDNNVPLTASVVTRPTNAATFTLNSDGSFTYLPNANFSGNDSFTYVAQDSLGATSGLATVTLSVTSVTPTNRPPVANGESFSTTANTTVNVVGNVLTNDTDADNNVPLTASVVTRPANAATFTLNSDGSFTYLPNANFSGSDSFTYVAQDSLGATSGLATVTLSVAPGTVTAPTANNDTLTVNAGGSLNIVAPGVLDNDTNPAGGSLTATLVNTAANGTLSLDPTGAVVYTPNAGFSGSDRFTYVATNGTGTSNTATVNIRVNAIPVARNDSGYTAVVGTPLTINVASGLAILQNDLDPDNVSLSASVVSNPASGTLSLNSNGSFVYTPNANFQGADSFTYVASDGLATSNTATVFLTVRSVATPIARPDNYQAATNGVLTVTQFNGVLFNDIDANAAGSARTATVVTNPGSGTLTTFNPDGSFIYRPNANFQGTDTFVYRFSDGLTVSNAATVTISVTPNTAPVGNPNNYTVAVGTTLSTNTQQGVLFNDTDPDPGTTLTATLNTTTPNGTLSLNPNGTFLYTPNANFAGTDTFVYQAGDGIALSNPTTATITVAARPTANSETYSVAPGGTLPIAAPGVLANDTDQSGLPLIAIPSVPRPTTRNGRLDFLSDGSFVYIPNPGFVGTDSFTYRANNSVLDSNVVTVTINVG